MATIPNGPYRIGASAASLAQNGATIDQNPTDYSSPQSAIAAGIDPATVYAAWAKGLAQYPTRDAAVAAGMMPGVVNVLWEASRKYVAQPAPSGPPAIVVLLVIGAALAFLSTQNVERWEL
jgi:hypothetical protein